jgi:hypothetical protein
MQSINIHANLEFGVYINCHMLVNKISRRWISVQTASNESLSLTLVFSYGHWNQKAK